MENETIERRNEGKNKNSMIKHKFFESRTFHAILFIGTAILIFSPLFIQLDFTKIRTLGLFGIALLNFISSSTMFIPTPGFIATGIGGTLFNPLLVALYSSVGSTLGEGVGYLFGYSSKRLTKSQRHILDVFNKLFHHKHTQIIIVIFSFIPNPFFDIIGILAGSSLFPIRRFLVLVFIGRFARDLIIASIGNLF